MLPSFEAAGIATLGALAGEVGRPARTRPWPAETMAEMRAEAPSDVARHLGRNPQPVLL